MATADGSVKARRRAEVRAFLHSDTSAGQSTVPVGSMVIDLTEDSGLAGTDNLEGNLDVDSEVKIVD